MSLSEAARTLLLLLLLGAAFLALSSVTTDLQARIAK